MQRINKIAANNIAKALKMDNGEGLVCTVAPKFKKTILKAMDEIALSEGKKPQDVNQQTQLMKQAIEKCVAEGKKITGSIKMRIENLGLCRSYNDVTVYDNGTQHFYKGCTWDDGRRACMRTKKKNSPYPIKVYSNKTMWYSPTAYDYLSKVLDWLSILGK